MQQGASAQIRSSEGNDQMMDRIANDVIERLQRNAERVQSERRR